MYGGKFAFKNRLGLPYSWQEIYRFSLFFFYLRAISKYKSPGAYIGLEGGFNGGFLCYEFGGLIFRGACFRNFMVCGI